MTSEKLNFLIHISILNILSQILSFFLENSPNLLVDIHSKKMVNILLKKNILKNYLNFNKLK